MGVEYDGQNHAETVEAFEEGNVSPAEKAALKTAEPIVEQVRERQTLREFDEFWSAAINVGTADVGASFARGFCLGVRVMLEVLR